MKRKMKLISILLLLIASAAFTAQKANAQGASVSFQVFYDNLSPYGTWIDSPQYGYVWIPNVAPGFTPYYTNGYWLFTDEGWTWVSDYSWGWAPFHYGRWFNDPAYGAMWVPDYEWGPGWVTWRRSEGYYGWAPIGPGVSISMAYGNGYQVLYNQWTFVRDRDFGRRNINNYYVNSSNNVTIINNSTVIVNTRVDRSRNVTYNAGPGRAEVEKHAGRTFTPVTIKESPKPGQNLDKNRLQIYRPQVQRNISNGAKPAPAKVERLENVKTSAQRKTEPPTQKVNPQPGQQPSPQQRPAQQPKQQPSQQQHQTQPAKQQAAPQQHQTQPVQQQPPRQQPVQPPKQQPAPQQHQTQPVQQQPPRQQPAQPPKQQPAQQQHPAQPAQQQHPAQPARQQPAPQQHPAQPAPQQHSPQVQQPNPNKNDERGKEPQQPKPPKMTGV